MNTSDPFSSANVPPAGAHGSSEPVLNQPFSDQPVPNQASPDPSAYPGQPGPSQPAYSQPPVYGAPQYGGYQQPTPPAPVDGVSIAAFATGLLMLGPVAAILGAVGLGRTANGVRSGRWMAWTGLILGVLGTIGWVVIIAVLGWMQDAIESNSGTSSTTVTTEQHEPVSPNADGYGDDPYLDSLWDACEGGDMAACDELYMESPFGSEYEKFGDDCGSAGRSSFQIFCDA